MEIGCKIQAMVNKHFPITHFYTTSDFAAQWREVAAVIRVDKTYRKKIFSQFFGSAVVCRVTRTLHPVNNKKIFKKVVNFQKILSDF